MKLEFYGSSDDLIYVTTNGDTASETEYMVAGGHSYAGHCLVTQGVNLLLAVHAVYDGCWTFAPAQAGEGIPFPEGLTISYLRWHEYSIKLVIDGLPDDAKLVPDGKPLWKE